MSAANTAVAQDLVMTGQPELPDGQGVAASEEVTEEASINPRKRKKSSRACDFCHVNHQPCDNAKPRCGYCEKHNKQCLYLRPQKKRGPAQGYRNALHTMRESAAAWGVAMTLIPTLSAQVESALRQTEEGRKLAPAIKETQQQDRFIQLWQQSGAFKAFFGDDPSVGDGEAEGDAEPESRPATAATTGNSTKGGQRRQRSLSSVERPGTTKLDHSASSHARTTVLTPSPSHDGGGTGAKGPAQTEHLQPSLSVSDLVAKDAERSSDGFSQTLGSLGFAPGETVEDFVAMSSNPEPIDDDFNPSLMSAQDQKTYYELIMGTGMGSSFFSS